MIEFVRSPSKGLWAGLALWCGAGTLALPAACTNCVSFAPGAALGTVASNNLTEASGLAASRRNPGVLWTHNDGSKQSIYALGTNGARLATFDMNKNVDDVEDIAVGPGPGLAASYLYVGDIGGNQGTNTVRSDVKIVRIPEPAVDLTWEANPRSPDFDGVETFTLVYPDGSYDAEGLMVDPISGDLFVVTKQPGAARIYRANLTGATNKATLAMEFIRSQAFSLASAADISADGTQITLRREDFAMLWQRCDNEAVGTALARDGQSIPVIGPPTEPNGEGFGFLADGTGYVTISEGVASVIYFFASLCPAPPRFTLALSNASVFAGGSIQFRSVAVGLPAPTFSWRFNGQSLAGQTGSTLSLSNLAATNAGQYQIVASNSSGVATSMAMLVVRPKPDLRITEVLSAAAASPGVPTGDWWELTSFESQPVSLTGWRFNDADGVLADAYVFGGTLVIGPGESVVFVEGLTAAQFRNWWGASSLSPALQIVTYTGNGLSLGANGDGLRLWNETTTDTNDTVARVSFGAATAGVTFNYDPLTGTFGGLSVLGAHGVFRASIAPDIGSPGNILAPVVPPLLHSSLAGGRIRIGFGAIPGHHYFLESRNDLEAGTWDPTGDTLQATNGQGVFFEKEAAANHRFYRVRGE
ncbi:MAG: lamin tail domain-containing protein [Verrucomicrobia bacterium]|nr:lamin tail domain-containing protein [Verrucomicrobiota bacterium]